MSRLLAVFVATLLPLVAPGAQAATFTVTGGQPFTLPTSFGYFHDFRDVQPGMDIVTNGTLALTGPGRVTFTYIASEPVPGEQHLFTVNGNTIFDTNGDNTRPATIQFGSGILPFGFASPNANTTVANGAPSSSFWNSIGFLQKSSTSVYAFLNDYNTWDRDYDEYVIRMDVAPIPLPAAAWFLLGGLGSLAAARRLGAARRR